ncbi:hypothetical protein PsorP6_005809 [Peronosclerospora sorghi]|uniref:Uncharacterized protein n=1 Tax=Peronosclerospora sorghi TaxID=230839 RepID=A0ACC0W3V5_9STRA|nr:hypothetical protein PsorP6_005809 [Peronosclerospora sorghi]
MQEIWRSNHLPAPLETDALEQHNLSTRTNWKRGLRRKMQEKRADQLQAQEHARAMEEAQRKRELLQSEYQRLSTGGVINTHKGEGTERESNEIEVLQAEKSRREPVLKEICEKTVEQDAKLKQLLADSERQRTTQEKQLEELTRRLALYQKLGRFFEHSADRIVVRFTQIDAQNPSRKFSFRITIDSITEEYIVDNCNEHVAPMSDLVKDLNDTGDLALFIRSMGRQFKQLV